VIIFKDKILSALRLSVAHVHKIVVFLPIGDYKAVQSFEGLGILNKSVDEDIKLNQPMCVHSKLQERFHIPMLLLNLQIAAKESTLFFEFIA
jgi:hypothetical protein